MYQYKMFYFLEMTQSTQRRTLFTAHLIKKKICTDNVNWLDIIFKNSPLWCKRMIYTLFTMKLVWNWDNAQSMIKKKHTDAHIHFVHPVLVQSDQ